MEEAQESRELSPGRANVAAARRGDRAAFASLHEQYTPMVHGMLLAQVGMNDADDLMQEVFLHAMRKLPTLRDSAAFGPWLATITRNFAAQFLRDRRRRVNVAQHVIAKPASGSETHTARGAAVRVLEVIRGLPEAYQETLILRLVEGLTGPQIATCTGLTEGSVRVNLHRGMNMLRDKLGLNAPAEEGR
ncbi:MAG: sigma-70 family RNA polymerase sigma factor [Planctomycetes bacterium]|nr:sigma-70 family RNA polymerase sigma factor [Planctomycetota bacterium]